MRPAGPGRRAASSAGFSVLEMLVSFTVLMVAVSLAADLMLESQSRIAHSARQALDPVAELALAQVRADVRSSTRVVGSDLLWSWAPLTLTGHPVGTVQYEKVGTDLVRKIVPGGGGEGSERIVLRQVTIWRWRLSSAAPLQLIELELAHREAPRISTLSAAGRRQAAIPPSRLYRLVIGPRLSAGRTTW